MGRWVGLLLFLLGGLPALADLQASSGGPAFPPSHAAGVPDTPADPWSRVPAILQRTVAPTFPARTVRITDFGAVGDGTTDCTEAFRVTIDACVRQGGGRVEVPPGRFLTGPIHLKSGVNLHVQRGASICFVPDPTRYLPPVRTRYEGNDCFNYSPFIYALDQRNVAITGDGVIDGQANVPAWREMKRDTTDSRALRAMAEAGTPVERRVFGGGHGLRPNMIQFIGCTGVLLDGITVKNSPMWSIHPVLCKNVTVRGVTVESRIANGDGIDPESCSDVHIDGCTLRTRDDAIALKSGRNADGRRVNVPCENVVIERCRIAAPGGEARNGIAIGSEISAGVRNIFVRDCAISERLRGISLKTNTLRGGFIRNIRFRDLRFDRIESAVLLIDLTSGKETGPYLPRVQGVELRSVVARGAGRIWEVIAPNPAAVSEVVLQDCDFRGVRSRPIPRYVGAISLLRSTANGRPLVTPAAPLLGFLPGPLALLVVGAAACFTGVLAARATRRLWPLSLLVFWIGCALLLQLEPTIAVWVGRPVPLVENGRVGLAWCLGSFWVAALGAVAYGWLSRSKRMGGLAAE